MTDPRLTIGMFTDTYLPEVNGVVTAIVATSKALRRRGHRVIVVAPASAGAQDEPDVFRFRSTPFPFYPQFRMAFPLPAKLLTTLPRLPFDVIHTHSVFFVSCLGAYLAQRRRIPLAFTYHTRLSDYAHYLPMHPSLKAHQAVWLSREFANRCDLVIAPTADIAELLRSYGVEKSIEIIPTGVDLESFRDGSSIPAGTSLDGPVALYAGRLGKEKNLDLMLEAFALAAARVPRARLIIAGDGPHDALLRERARDLGIADSVRFVGSLSQAELGAYYRAADVFVFASTSETQGLVLAEAMAHGLPIAAVDCPVSREIVSKDAGVLVSESPEALANAIVSVLASTSAERARRSAAALAAAAPYAVDALADRLEALYLQARGVEAARK